MANNINQKDDIDDLINQAAGAMLGELIKPIYAQKAEDFYKKESSPYDPITQKESTVVQMSKLPNNDPKAFEQLTKTRTQDIGSDIVEKSRYVAHNLAVYEPDISRYGSFATRIWILLVRGISTVITSIVKIFGVKDFGRKRLIDSPLKGSEHVIFSHFTIGEAVSAGVVFVMIIWGLRRIIRWLRGIVKSMIGEEYDASQIILDTVNENKQMVENYYNHNILNESNTVDNADEWFTKEKLEVIRDLSDYIKESKKEIESPTDDSNLSIIEKIKLRMKRNRTFTEYLIYITTGALFGFIFFYYKK